ncbi:Cobalt-precorrin-6y C5-methyltransferase [Acidisarcina polymorpha]|uniref:Cobalt-precorrin-6y C5-methyltransferase n=1 Tax=Acidisarcina polymorpha TaxID=2211140 RepID=A0A2Z5G558_9BACT|nr:precorrin-6y C5,15-methyltransferase (decarboxylating) subunit CbiE [Acidisarcina polymorpha]AXC14312.1 Cobalt-precorrin-6y C5-methyltransferase [Acidisarcina polymorpha]
MSTLEPWLAVIGVGEDGWSGLSAKARDLIQSADLLYGGKRHLDLIPGGEGSAERVAWPSPMGPAVDQILNQHRGRRSVAVLASGDPMLFGVGVSLTRKLSPPEFWVIPHISSFSLACARLGWPVADTVLISLVNRPPEQLLRYLCKDQRLVLFSEDGATPSVVAKLLTQSGYGESAFHVFEHLGGPSERQISKQAATWTVKQCAQLNLIAVQCIPDASTRPLSIAPGLPDNVFQSDGQLTKREVRAITLASLSPLPRQVLWDVGAGTGTIAIEWMRVHPSSRAIAFETRSDRAAQIRVNAKLLGTPGLQVIEGTAPSAFADIEPPDAIFIGGGASTPGLFEACWGVLRTGGRLVVNAVTIQTEVKIADWHTLYGGNLVRIAISRSVPVGRAFGWRPMMPITQWSVTKE